MDHFLTHAKAYTATASVPITVLVVWLIETFGKVTVPMEIRTAIGMLLAGFGTAVVSNAPKA
jgi:hypothetical protein